MSEYIAASIIVHCSDGWGYLSRSVESLLNGDVASSIHFAYYAELRAAMSLMGSGGVGIFNRKHVWFDAAGNPELSPGNIPTHKAVADGMIAWAKLASKKGDLFKLLRVNNRDLTDWIRETGFSTRSGYSTSIINRWLEAWSIDLHLTDDQILRNEMSYRPHFNASPNDISSTISKLTEIWNVLEPTAANRFPLLDKYLLRTSLEEIFRRVRSAKPNGLAFENFIKNLFQRLGEDTSQVLFDFLLRLTEADDHLIFKEARKDRSNPQINRLDPLPIISRAILLLRLCTGAANRMIAVSSLNTNNLRYWWEDLCKKNGNISEIPSGIDAIDLYTDIRDSLEEINLLHPSRTSNVKNAFMSAANPLFYLKQFQRTAIWGLGL